MLKRSYERFIEAWNNEKKYQKYVIEEEGALPDSVQPLGRKPTFKMWLTAIRQKKITLQGTVPAAATEEKQVQVEEPTWDE
jgi:hypothetical protein